MGRRPQQRQQRLPKKMGREANEKAAGKAAKEKSAKNNDKKSLKGSGLEKEHPPSGASLEKSAENKINELRDSVVKISDAQASEIRKSVRNNAPTIAVPPDIHAEGQNWRYKNTPGRISQDTENLNEAVKRIQMPSPMIMENEDHGCKNTYDKAAQELRNLDWDQHIKNAITNVTKAKE